MRITAINKNKVPRIAVTSISQSHNSAIRSTTPAYADTTMEHTSPRDEDRRSKCQSSPTVEGPIERAAGALHWPFRLHHWCSLSDWPSRTRTQIHLPFRTIFLAGETLKAECPTKDYNFLVTYL